LNQSGLKVLFVAGFGPLVRDPAKSKRFYVDMLGLPLKAMPGNDIYLHGEGLDGVRHFALWPLAQAAQSCFGTDVWPADVPAPQSWLELDVEDIVTATAWLKAQGCKLLVEARVEPWGQTVTRMLSPEGILVAITVSPNLR
jgi:catechol 2,3-dioxygenase-like lactoylglutathione lyase family enzyme